VRRGMALAAAGVAIGLAASLALTRVMTGLLFQISTMDPLTFVGIPAVLILAALLASLIPGLRAVKVDPMVALRYE
jgi:putative ABC transport system permease protein